MIADAAPQLILTDTQLAVRLQGAPVLCLDLLVLDPAHRFAPAVNLTPANLAYVIFTSGSTGRPKGAMNSHAGIVNRLRWMQHAFGLEPLDRVLQKTPFGFDVSVWEFFWPLIEGAALVVARPEGHKDAYYLANLIQSAGITTTHFVPSMLQVFLQEPDAGACVGLGV
jgi:non-ribosomal peptide synthetase component F